MPKRGRPRSQASQDADNQLRVDIDSVVDDIIPVALAKRFRERLAEIGPGTSVQPPKPDGQASVAPDVDRPLNEVCQGGATMSAPLGDVAGLGVPAYVHTSIAATHMEVVGAETGGVGKTVHERREITKGGNAKVGSSGDETGRVREGGKEVVTTTKQKCVKVISDMSCPDGRVKRGHEKQPVVTKRPPLSKEKGIVISEAGTGGISSDVPLKIAAGRVKGKEKVNKAKEAIRSQDLNVETTRLRKASPAMRSPFNERAVRLTAKANGNDKELYFWVLSTAETHKSIRCVLFVLHLMCEEGDSLY
ncbi:hypothetical protein SASPL_137752 [Salvia splendens]|uniref:Uncharacterized protein n=1 Tax=Salvia splendens TaxID=180675 RepID=A0A8X8ZDP5_SALSN|nr:hypothetical protein SASPL_137752 [Salvia splendens]